MLKKKLRRLSAILMAGVMTISMIGTAFATGETTTPPEDYTPTDSYVLNFDGKYDGPQWQYFSLYWPAYKYDGVSDYTQSISFTLYDTNNKEHFWTYCTDVDTGLDANSNFRRLNLEDSTYAAAGAGLIRSIVLKGFPNVDVAALGAAAGVTDLTVGEAVAATQAAIWKAAHGNMLDFTDFCRTIDCDWDPAATEHYADCTAEYETYGFNDNDYFPDPSVTGKEEIIESHIKAVFNYLTNLAPTAPSQVAASAASFKSWSETPVLEKNEDGSYNVKVSATVDVVVSADDAMTLTAVLGDYSASAALANGNQTIELTIENVPADKAHDAVIIAIDGLQTVSDVFLFDAEGERSTSQSLVGILGSQLPVHAEVKVEPERKINIHKVSKVLDKDGNVSAGDPLEGIVFSVYKVCTLEDYLNGKVKLNSKPTEAEVNSYAKAYKQIASVATDKDGMAVINLSKLGQPDGVYMVVEESHPAIEMPTDPFFVMVPNSVSGSWDYEIDVQPKNIVKAELAINKDVLTLDKNEGSVNAAEAFPWIIRTNIPKDIATGKSFVISDTLDSRLDYVGNEEVAIYTTMGEEALLAEDFTAAYDEASRKLTVALTETGMEKAGAAVGADSEIRVYFYTKTNGATLADEIPNQADVEYKSAHGYAYNATSDIPVVYTGAANLLKVDGNTKTEVEGVISYSKVLSGATFQVYRAATEADTETVYVDGIDAPVVLVEFFDNAAMTGEKVTSVTSDADGKVAIYGLAYGTYYLVETAAPAGYNLLPAPAQLVIAADTHTESKVMTVENYGGFELPETGGIGTTVYTLMGSLTMAASGMYIFRKKRED